MTSSAAVLSRIRSRIGRWADQSPPEDEAARRARIVDEFAEIYYAQAADGGTWNRMAWLGHPLLKNPLDLWIYQELIASTKPDLIIETGTFCGGSALFLAGVCEMLGTGEVISADIAAEETPEHPRVTYLAGSSVADDVVAVMRERAEGRRTMLILDSDHRAPHVAAELAVLSPLVSPGCYLVVEDTNVNGHPVLPDHGPGPMEALLDFLPTHPEFSPDRDLEKFLFTFNPNGYLLRSDGSGG
jgi:cephalosporin hydroxylase